jgi:hypothetical protein
MDANERIREELKEVARAFGRLVMALFIWGMPRLGHLYAAVMVVALVWLAWPGQAPALVHSTLWIGLWVYVICAIWTSITMVTYGYLVCGCAMKQGIWRHLRGIGIKDVMIVLLMGPSWPFSWLLADQAMEEEDVEGCWLDVVLNTAQYWTFVRYRGFLVRMKNPITGEEIRFRARTEEEADRIRGELLAAAVVKKHGSPPS